MNKKSLCFGSELICTRLIDTLGSGDVTHFSAIRPLNMGYRSDGMPTIYNQLLEVVMPLNIIGNQWIKWFVIVVKRKLQGLKDWFLIIGLVR